MIPGLHASQVASELWPISSGPGKDDDDDQEDEGLTIEEQIAKEVSDIKKPKSEQRFGMFALYSI
jgi:tRNA acetyltransferase TAN1